MKLKATEKQFWVPLLTFVVSAALYAALLRSWWVMLTIPTLAGSVGVFGFYNFDRLTKGLREWFNRDD